MKTSSDIDQTKVNKRKQDKIIHSFDYFLDSYSKDTKLDIQKPKSLINKTDLRLEKHAKGWKYIQDSSYRKLEPDENVVIQWYEETRKTCDDIQKWKQISVDEHNQMSENIKWP